MGPPILPRKDHLPSRVLIHRSFFLGDVILSLPVAQALKRQRPDIRIGWLVREEWRGLLEGHSVVDEVIGYSGASMSSWRAPMEFFRVLRRLRKGKWDLFLNLSWDRSSMLWAFLSGAATTIGIEEYGRPRLLSLTCSTTVQAPERSLDGRSMADFYFEPLKLLGFGPREEGPRLWPTTGETASADRLTKGWPLCGRRVLIHPGSRLEHKRWPRERYAALIHRLVCETDVGVMLVCGPGEESWTQELARGVDPERSRIIIAPTLGELMALSQSAAVCVGNDSGPMHLAAASGRRVVSIFGKGAQRWRPVGDQHKILTHPDGLPAIEVDSVFAAVCVSLATQLIGD